MYLCIYVSMSPFIQASIYVSNGVHACMHAYTHTSVCLPACLSLPVCSRAVRWGKHRCSCVAAWHAHTHSPPPAPVHLLSTNKTIFCRKQQMPIHTVLLQFQFIYSQPIRPSALERSSTAEARLKKIQQFHTHSPSLSGLGVRG